MARGLPAAIESASLCLACSRRSGGASGIVVVTAYDYAAARLADRAGVDIVLVGDTAGIMALGYDTTVPVTMDDMVHHVRAVRRGLKGALLLADLPFGSYQSGWPRRDTKQRTTHEGGRSTGRQA